MTKSPRASDSIADWFDSWHAAFASAGALPADDPRLKTLLRAAFYGGFHGALAKGFTTPQKAKAQRDAWLKELDSFGVELERLAHAGRIQ